MNAFNKNQQLTHLYWIGGSPCGGKSTIAARLAEQYDLTVYHIDEHMQTHFQNINTQDQPHLSHWSESTWDERWMQPGETLLQNAIGCYQEHFDILINEVLAIPADQPTIIEGNPLFPANLQALLPGKSHALWICAAPHIQWQYYRRRESINEILSQCRQPQMAFGNWMRRDQLFAEWIISECERCQMPILLNDGSLDLAEISAFATRHFGFQTAAFS